MPRRGRNGMRGGPRIRFKGAAGARMGFDREYRLVVWVVPGRGRGGPAGRWGTAARGGWAARRPSRIRAGNKPAKGGREGGVGDEGAPGDQLDGGRRGSGKGEPRRGYDDARHMNRGRGAGAEMGRHGRSSAASPGWGPMRRKGGRHRRWTGGMGWGNSARRGRSARKVRKTYCLSKDWWVYCGVTFRTMYSYNFCWPVRTLKTESGEDRTPAMMAKLTDHVWTLAEWIMRPAVQLV